MSTTVTYKGATLTTVSNDTAVLETAGTYLEDDLTLVDVSGGGSPTLQNKTVYPSSSDQSITADNGYDGLGTVTAKAVTLANLTAENIKDGVTVKVGDVDDDDRVASVTGTYAGGGGGLDADTGDFTLVSDSNDVTITTTKLRNRLYIWADSLPSTSNNLVFTFCEYDWPTTDYRGMYGYIGTYPSISQQATISVASHTASTFNIKPHASTRQFVSGIKYNYIAF